MVEFADHAVFDDARKHVEVDDHPRRWSLGDEWAVKRHVEPVRVAVQPRTFARVIRQHVRGLEFELLADEHDPPEFTARPVMAFSAPNPEGVPAGNPERAPAMLSTNRAHLVAMHVAGEIAPASVPASLYDIGFDGVARILPSVGGICLNVRVGDNAIAPAGDHIEPAVSARAKDDRANVGFCVLACVGNTATVLGGDAKGETGVVTGKHGGIEHVMIDFPEQVLARLTIGDRIGIRAFGVGLTLDAPAGVSVFNCDPDFFDQLGITLRDDKLHVPVAKVVPAAIMGSGLGRATVARGDYDIQTFDPQMVAQYGLDELRFGDIVAITDADHRFGRIYRTGAVSIGIVAHGRSFIAGHGPGVTSLLTSATGALVPVLDPGANIATILRLR